MAENELCYMQNKGKTSGFKSNDGVSKRNNEARIKKDELELEELKKQARAARV